MLAVLAMIFLLWLLWWWWWLLFFILLLSILFWLFLLMMILLLLPLLSIDDRHSLAWFLSKQIFNPAQNRSKLSIPDTGVTRLKQSITPVGIPFDPSSCQRASMSDNRTKPVRLSPSIISNNVRILETNFFGKFSNGLELQLLECELLLVLLPLWQLLFVDINDDCCIGGDKWWATECTDDWLSITFISGTHVVNVFRFIVIINLRCL